MNNKSVSQWKQNTRTANRRKLNNKPVEPFNHLSVSVQNKQQGLVLTEVLDSVVALLVVHFDGLSVGTADPVADGVTTHHDVLVLRWRPAHHDAVDQRPDVERAGLVWYTRFWWRRCSQKTQLKFHHFSEIIKFIKCWKLYLKNHWIGIVCINWVKQVMLPSRSLSNVSAVVHSVAGPVPFTVMADTRKVYSVPRSRPGQETDSKPWYLDWAVIELNLKQQ